MSCILPLKRLLPSFVPILIFTALIPVITMAQAGETTNKIGITMINIPAGSFLMGSCKAPEDIEEKNKKRAYLGQPPLTDNCPDIDTEGHLAYDNETPQHRVNINAFQMSKTEVTLGQFKEFIIAAGRSDLVNEDFMKCNSYGDSSPVVQVSWHDALAFIKWLNKTAGSGYRLPSEAEWEYACRAGGDHAYCGSNNLDTVGWTERNSGGSQHPVGGKQANAFNLHDMNGNVWEWVQDCWHDSYRGAPSNGSPWTNSCFENDDDGGILRGGAWNFYGWRPAERNYVSRAGRDGFNGFRLARSR